MDINPSTAIFAIINFIVLVVVLKVFLYKPVCNMLDSRKQEVVNNLNSAEEAKLEAQKLRDELQLRFRMPELKRRKLLIRLQKSVNKQKPIL